METQSLSDDWEPVAVDGFLEHVGGYSRRRVNGVLEFAFVARDFHVNRSGVVQGGMIMTFVDRAFGEIARDASGATRTATISLTHQFMAPMPIGAVAVMAPRVSRLTRRMAFLDGTVFVDGAAVVSATGVWRLIHDAGD